MVSNLNHPTSVAQFGGLQTEAEGEKLSRELSLKYTGVGCGGHIFKIVARSFGVILMYKSKWHIYIYIYIYEDMQTEDSLFARFQHTGPPSVAGRYAGVIQFKYGCSSWRPRVTPTDCLKDVVIQLYIAGVHRFRETKPYTVARLMFIVIINIPACPYIPKYFILHTSFVPKVRVLIFYLNVY